MILLLLAGLAATVTVAAPPSWMSGKAVQRAGTKVTTLCEGTGPARDLARRSAMDQCRRLAADELLDSFRVNSLSVSSERSVAFHEEINSDRKVTGLACISKRDLLEPMADGTFKAYLECSFELSIARIESGEDVPPPKRTISSARSIVVYSIPACADILVVGKRSRSVACSGGSAVVAIEPGDANLIVRASGRLPAHVDLGAVTADTLEVKLEIP